MTNLNDELVLFIYFICPKQDFYMLLPTEIVK